MKRKFLLLSLWVSLLAASYAQTPTYFVHNPSNMGVNNSYMHNSVMKKFLFIYNKAELNAAGISGATSFNTIWFRMNNAGTVNLSNCVITIGHTSLTSTTPNTTFASNFNVGAPVTVLSSNPLSYTFAAGTWNVPTNVWSPITLTTSFTYNDVNNLAVMIEFSAQTGGIPSLYADNGGAPITRYTNTVGGGTATSTTARPAFGISSSTPLFTQPILASNVSTNSLSLTTTALQPIFTKQTLGYSLNNGESWSLTALSAIYPIWTLSLPTSKTLYRMYFSDKDGNSYASNVVEIEGMSQSQDISVYPMINQGTFTINYPEVNYGSLVIKDLNGKTVHTIAENKTLQMQVQLSLPSGLYLIQDCKQGKSFKIVIQ